MNSLFIDIKNIVDETFNEFSSKLNSQKKKDKSWVTEIDLEISKRVKNILPPDLNYISEEEEKKELTFPALIIDPVDGTEGLVKGTGEWCCSVAIMYSENWDDPRNQAMIYAPEKEFYIDDEEVTTLVEPKNVKKCLISRNEWSDEFLDKVKENSSYEIKPYGSIALKLGLVASQEIDFVFSLRPKNIWDIAAGVILVHKRGFQSIQHGEIMSKATCIRYEPHLFFGEKEVYQDLF